MRTSIEMLSPDPHPLGTRQQQIETAKEDEEKTETTKRTDKKTQEIQQEVQRRHKITMSSKKNVKKAEEMKKNIATKSAEEEKKEIAINEYADNHKTRTGSTTTNNNNNSSKESNKNGEENNDKNDKKKTNNGDKSNTSNNGKNKNNGEGNKTRVSILTPEEMTTYTFTISWRLEHKAGQDGKIIIKMLTGFRLLPQYWGREKGVLFSRGCISLKNRSYRPLLRDNTSPFKHTCLLIRV
jgi:hypothetical protein